MKQLLPALLGLAGLLLASFSGVAQQIVGPGNPGPIGPLTPVTHPCMPNRIETDPPRASNTQYPLRTNTFNWYNGAAEAGRSYNINWTAPSNPTIRLPWEQTDNDRLTHILGRRDTPAQGWQLIKHDMGYSNLGVALTAIKNPYIVIYNRYTGTLRVFVAMGEIAPGYSFAEIKLFFDGGGPRKAGTLNRASGLGVALEDMPIGAGPTLAAVIGHQNEFRKWFFADFSMEYDPCTCLFDSKFSVQINLVDVMNVQLRGLSTGTLMTANQPTGASFESNEQRQSPFSFNKIGNTIDKGKKTYNTINSFASGVRSILNVTGTNTGTSPTAKLSALASLQAALSQSNFLKAGLSSVPYIGAAVSALDFFLGGGKEEAAPAQPLALQPMTIEFSTETKGTIEANRLYGNITFNNPGTPPPSTTSISIPEQYPYYNEALGVFSLLRRPTVDMVITQTVDWDASGTYQIWTFEHDIRFHDLLHFTVNPASGLRVQDMQVALVTDQNTSANTLNGNFSEYEGPTMMPGVTPTAQAVQAQSFRTPYWNPACLTTPIHNITTHSPNYTGWNVSNMYMKLIINLTRIVPSATAQNVLLVLKYPVAINIVSDFPVTVPTCASTNAVPEPAPLAELTAFCTSTEYAAATLMPRPAGTPSGTSAATKPATRAPRRTNVLAAYPNPAADQITLRYTVEQRGPVQVDIRDALGRTVAQAVNRADHPTGTFDAAVSTAQLPAGVYHCTLVAPTYQQTTKLVVAR